MRKMVEVKESKSAVRSCLLNCQPTPTPAWKDAGLTINLDNEPSINSLHSSTWAGPEHLKLSILDMWNFFKKSQRRFFQLVRRSWSLPGSRVVICSKFWVWFNVMNSYTPFRLTPTPQPRYICTMMFFRRVAAYVLIYFKRVLPPEIYRYHT